MRVGELILATEGSFRTDDSAVIDLFVVTQSWEGDLHALQAQCPPGAIFLPWLLARHYIAAMPYVEWNTDREECS